MVFGGKPLFILRQLWFGVIWLSIVTNLDNYFAYTATFKQFETRQLSNQANGLPTFFRPDEIAIQSQTMVGIQLGELAIVIATLALFYLNVRGPIRLLGRSPIHELTILELEDLVENAEYAPSTSKRPDIWRRVRFLVKR